MEERIDVGTYFVIAETFIGIDATALRARPGAVQLAASALAAPFAEFGGFVAYPDVPQRAAIMCSRLVRNHPLPDGNKRAAHAASRLYLTFNDWGWDPAGDDMAVADAVEGVAARRVSEDDLVALYREWATPPT